MVFENIELEIQDNVALLRINRPQFLNALNKATIHELHQAIQWMSDDSKIRVIILTGAGEKSFVAGADIKEFVTFNQQEGEALSREGQELLFTFIEKCKKPIIAAINGFALGGGLELALSCHIRIASENAKLGLPELSLGLIPGYGGTQRLTQMIGKGRALEIMLSSKMIFAHDALNMGLVNHVYAQEDLIDEAKKLALLIAKNSPIAVSKLLEAVQVGTDLTVGLQKEIELFGACFGTDDFKEGTTAFLEKRKPNFK